MSTRGVASLVSFHCSNLMSKSVLWLLWQSSGDYSSEKCVTQPSIGKTSVWWFEEASTQKKEKKYPWSSTAFSGPCLGESQHYCTEEDTSPASCLASASDGTTAIVLVGGAVLLEKPLALQAQWVVQIHFRANYVAATQQLEAAEMPGSTGNCRQRLMPRTHSWPEQPSVGLH